MSDDDQRIEVITGAARRRRWTTEEKLRIVDETLRSGESVSRAVMALRRTCSIVGGG
jgi:transposase